MNSKTCSVIVPIYNAAPYLAQCLSSIKMQTYSDLQVILIDDGSTDESGVIAHTFVDGDPRFSLYQQTNHGQGAARNRALTYATGEYLVFVDADDYLDLDFIEKHITAIGDADYVQSGYRRVSADGNVLGQKLPIHRYQFTSPWMRLYRLEWIQRNACSFPEGMIYEDVVFSLQVWSKHPHATIIPYVGYHYTFNPTSTTTTIHPEQQHILYQTIQSLQCSWWLKTFTILRLKWHFLLNR